MMVERMANEIGIPIRFVLSLARTASYEYKVYEIPKRTGGTRVIHHPSRRLKALQRWLLINVIEALPVHPAATAYRKSRSIFDNARVHAASRYLLRMDFKDFFPSITQVDLARYIAEHSTLFPGWTPSDIDVFCRLVCRNSALTIGAPTSPGLSNAICYDLDVDLHALSEKHSVTYTRYADDLFFSTEQQDVLRQIEENVIKIISELKVPANLRVNVAKTRYSSKRGERRVTGIVLGSDGHAHIGRGLKRRVRALIHKFDSLGETDRRSLAGMIAYARGFDPEFLNSLINKYGLPVVRRAMAAPPMVDR
jgi:RNA-directed DNA polymerase